MGPEASLQHDLKSINSDDRDPTPLFSFVLFLGGWGIGSTALWSAVSYLAPLLSPQLALCLFFIHPKRLYILHLAKNDSGKHTTIHSAPPRAAPSSPTCRPPLLPSRRRPVPALPAFTRKAPSRPVGRLVGSYEAAAAYTSVMAFYLTIIILTNSS